MTGRRDISITPMTWWFGQEGDVALARLKFLQVLSEFPLLIKRLA